MNKKLLKGALALFASIFMAVSCSAGDKTGGGNNTPSVSKSDVETFLSRLDSDASLTVASGTKLESGNTFAVKLVANKATQTVEAIKAAIASKLEATDKIQKVDAGDIEDNRFEVTADTAAVTYTIKLKAKTGYNIGSYATVKVVVTPESGKEWKKFDITADQFKAALLEALSGLNIGGTPINLAIGKIALDDTGEANKILVIVDVTEINDAQGKKNAGETALNGRFDNVKTSLENIGINVTAENFGTTYGVSTVKLSTEDTAAKELGLFAVKASEFNGYATGPLSHIKITLKAGGSNAWN